MDACNVMLSASYIVNEEIARQVFEMLPDGTPVLAIVDTEGHRWISDSEALARLNLPETWVDELRAQIDDGAEPALLHADDATVVAAQLRTEEMHCGYVVLVLPRNASTVTPAELDLVDVVLAQFGVIARLVERCSQLSDIERKCYSAYGTSHTPVN